MLPRWLAQVRPSSRRKRRIALLIDGDSIPATHGRQLVDAISKLGTVTVRRVYGHPTAASTRKWHKLAPELGFKPEHCARLTYGKNSADMWMATEAIDLLHTLGRRIDAFCLVTSDSDLTPVAMKIREHGLEVFGLGHPQTPNAFRAACTTFAVLEDYTGLRAATHHKTDTKRLMKARTTLMEVLRTCRSGDGDIEVSVFGTRLRERFPDFRPGRYGHRNLTSLLEALGMLEQASDGLYVRPGMDEAADPAK